MNGIASGSHCPCLELSHAPESNAGGGKTMGVISWRSHGQWMSAGPHTAGGTPSRTNPRTSGRGLAGEGASDGCYLRSCRNYSCSCRVCRPSFRAWPAWKSHGMRRTTACRCRTTASCCQRCICPTPWTFYPRHRSQSEHP
eukprot:scaffold3607_cov114-Isochrysis_galbana.AAC.16